MSDESKPHGPVTGPFSLLLTLNTLTGRARARTLPLTLTPQPGEPATWKASLGNSQSAAHENVEDAMTELEQITR